MTANYNKFTRRTIRGDRGVCCHCKIRNYSLMSAFLHLFADSRSGKTTVAHLIRLIRRLSLCQGHFTLLCLHKTFHYNFLIHVCHSHPRRVVAAELQQLFHSFARFFQGSIKACHYRTITPNAQMDELSHAIKKFSGVPKSLNWMFQQLCSCSGHDFTCKRSQAAQLMS